MRHSKLHTKLTQNDYYYVISKSLVTTLEAVLKAEEIKRSSSSGAVYRMKAFYSLRKKYEAWLADMDWILSIKWDTLLATPELFDEETDSDELLPSTAGVEHKELATEVATILSGVNLGSIFRLTSGEGALKVDRLVGVLA
ncbi:Hypothetical protein PHPALM_36323 [Phytophthora palmivora]|uniref:Uncharacterized protein n=1 Tax=Phytophthora palmivora TaxID=4796 RepID=A0A2P4X092_9STRA|nr:Hypothetical protein PHPALM_36323 [Phytophthora palmivora]